MNSRLAFISVLIMTLAATASRAQPRSAGGVFSATGIEVSYQHHGADSTFFELNAGVDFCDVLDGTVSSPGAKLNFSYNFIFWGHVFDSGYMSASGGIGLAAGYVRQPGELPGPMAGLVGKIGLEYRFKVPVILSLDLSPILGMKLDGTGSESRLKMYSEGLVKSYYPRLGIRYSF